MANESEAPHHTFKMENNGKRKRKEDENGSISITSPLSTKREVREDLDTEVKQISFVNLISESDKQSNLQSKEQKSNMQSKEKNGYFDDWNPNFFRPANCDVKEGLIQRVTTLEMVVPSILKAIEELKEMIKTISCTHNTPSRGVPHEEPKPKGSVRLLFPEKGDKSPIVLTETLTGSYTVTPRKGKETHSKLVGPTIPKWLPLMFHPKKKMELNHEECNLAIYIFGCPPNQETDREEIMISTDLWYQHGTRNLLQSLKPQKMISQDVIDFAVCMLTYDAKKDTCNPKNWFLPSTLSQFVLSWNSPVEKMKKYYKGRFMGNADVISKIFLPIHDLENLHWYLLVIDFVRKELVYLDSYRNSSVVRNRITSIKTLSTFMEQLLMDPSFYDTDSNYGKRITEFKLVTPKGLGRQGEGSNDCAVWVINWMMQQGENEYKIEVDEGSRLKIALQLTLHPFNKNRDLMLTKSLEHKQAFVKGNDLEEKN
ncbi:uncharacterized protein LOC123882231 isoform X2 [Trifolium pratense]|uniref:uncharacterized protein LOC123882231 isoform X2 n=1 Tax=Trifolium pratense TaxID=57577 RepID=UPI001E69807C|nr:uncharacterized protein LOC123882231 isoform X2 [Trifolium pratense]XP_045787003.1 uncharacterized protein LOC123882231 isoform X2 [Trifolium pratense]